jgi:hypothetical protein
MYEDVLSDGDEVTGCLYAKYGSSSGQNFIQASRLPDGAATYFLLDRDGFTKEAN